MVATPLLQTPQALAEQIRHLPLGLEGPEAKEMAKAVVVGAEEALVAEKGETLVVPEVEAEDRSLDQMILMEATPAVIPHLRIRAAMHRQTILFAD